MSRQSWLCAGMASLCVCVCVCVCVCFHLCVRDIGRVTVNNSLVNSHQQEQTGWCFSADLLRLCTGASIHPVHAGFVCHIHGISHLVVIYFCREAAQISPAPLLFLLLFWQGRCHTACVGWAVVQDICNLYPDISGIIDSVYVVYFLTRTSLCFQATEQESWWSWPAVQVPFLQNRSSPKLILSTETSTTIPSLRFWIAITWICCILISPDPGAALTLFILDPCWRSLMILFPWAAQRAARTFCPLPFGGWHQLIQMTGLAWLAFCVSVGRGAASLSQVQAQLGEWICRGGEGWERAGEGGEPPRSDREEPPSPRKSFSSRNPLFRQKRRLPPSSSSSSSSVLWMYSACFTHWHVLSEWISCRANKAWSIKA